MKIIKPSAEIVYPASKYDVMKHIELCGRVCYKSEENAKEGTAERFLTAIYNRGHLSVFEHYRFIMEIPDTWYQAIADSHPEYISMSKYNGHCVVSANARALLTFVKECEGLGKLCNCTAVCYLNEMISAIIEEYRCAPLFGGIPGHANENVKFLDFAGLTDREFVRHGWFTARFVCDRGVSHEFVRHRKGSFSQESSRYCNYNCGKFGNEISVIKPCFYSDSPEDDTYPLYQIWKNSCENDEKAYMELMNAGARPEQARDNLPTSTKTELVMTMTVEGWVNFFQLRCDKAAHPQARELAIPLLEKAKDSFGKPFTEL